MKHLFGNLRSDNLRSSYIDIKFSNNSINERTIHNSKNRLKYQKVGLRLFIF
jgi:hypothetical protein